MALKIATVNVQGKVGSGVRLGLPTDGDLSDGLVALDENGSVVEAIDTLNEAAKTVDEKDGGTILVGAPTDGDYTDGQQPIVAADKIADAVDSLNVGLKNINDSVAALLDRVGWARIVTVTEQAVAPPPTYLDPPNNTILQTVTVTALTFDVIVECAYPTVEVNSVSAVLPLVGSVYRGAVSVTLAGSGPVVVEAFDPDGNAAAQDTIAVTVDLPPNITAATFTGGYPGGQTELKEDDTFQLQVTADKSFSSVVVSDVGAGKPETLTGFPAGTSATVTITIADRGDAAQLLGARVAVTDTVTGASSATYDTDSAGSVDGVNVLNLNNLHPLVVFGTITYPPSQQAIKVAESALVGNTVTDFDGIAYQSPNGQVLPNLPLLYETTKTVTYALGAYNVDGDGGVNNLRITATRDANASQTIEEAIVNIAAVAPTATVSEATTRVRSGVAPGSDTTITVAADQQLSNAPNLAPAVGLGAFTGSWAGGPKTWTRALRVPDADNPATGAANAWGSFSIMGLAGLISAVITGDNTYIVGGFTVRTINFLPVTAESTETFPLTDQTKLAAGSFSNGNAAVVQPFGTPDTMDSGKEGWCAPTAASGTAVKMRMLHSPSVAANAVGLTLSLVEETT